MPPEPDVYNADVDEMTAWGLATLANVRGLLVARFASDANLCASITDILDEYAADLVERVTDDEDELADDDTADGPLLGEPW